MELVACQTKDLLYGEAPTRSLLLEGYNLWHGEGEIRDEDNRLMEVITVDSKNFHITKNDAVEFDDCVLFRGDTYITRWRYVVSSTGKFKNSKKRSSVSDTVRITVKFPAFYVF